MRQLSPAGQWNSDIRFSTCETPALDAYGAGNPFLSLAVPVVASPLGSHPPSPAARDPYCLQELSESALGSGAAVTDAPQAEGLPHLRRFGVEDVVRISGTRSCAESSEQHWREAAAAEVSILGDQVGTT